MVTFILEIKIPIYKGSNENSKIFMIKVASLSQNW